MRKLTILLFIISAIFADNQIPDNVKQFIPKGYNLLNFTKGDLNRDKIEDAILILKDKKEENASYEPYKRPLYILIGEKNQNYKIVAKNENAVLTLQDGGTFGDPFSGVTIKKGYFSIEYYGGSAWRWSRVVTFKYNKKKKNWFLHRDGVDSFNSLNLDEVETTIKTVKDFGVVKFEDFNILSAHSTTQSSSTLKTTKAIPRAMSNSSFFSE